jgi:VanZ family protein
VVLMKLFQMIKAYLPAFLWLMFITGLSVMPGVQLPAFHLFSADKLAHAVVYGVLTWLLLRAYALTRKDTQTPWKEVLLSGVSIVYGVLMEFVQYAFIPGRFYEYDDMLANAIGVMLGWLCFKWFRK